MAIEIGLKRVDELFRDGRFEEAAAECDRLLCCDISSNEHSQVLRDKARVLLAQGGVWEGKAVGCLRDALNLAVYGSDESARVLVALTAAFAALGRWSSCREHHSLFMHLCESNDSAVIRSFRPLVDFNLAVAHHNAERLEEAETYYLQALDSCRQDGAADSSTVMKFVYHNLVDVFQELDRHEDAFRLVKHNDLPDEVYGAQIRNRKAQYALYRGDLEAAMLWAESGLGHTSLDIRTKASLHLTKAKILRAAGDSSQAYQYAREARRLAGDLPTISETLRASKFIKELE